MEIQIISKKLESIEEELHSIKNAVLKSSKQDAVSLKGMLKGIKISEQEVGEAKRSIFHAS